MRKQAKISLIAAAATILAIVVFQVGVSNAQVIGQYVRRAGDTMVGPLRFLMPSGSVAIQLPLGVKISFNTPTNTATLFGIAGPGLQAPQNLLIGSSGAGNGMEFGLSPLRLWLDGTNHGIGITYSGGNLFIVGGGLTASGNVLVNTGNLSFSADIGRILFNSTDSTAAPGNATINKASGRSAIAAGAQTCVITSNLVGTTTHPFVNELNADPACTYVRCVPTANTLTCTSYSAVGVATNCTNQMNFDWITFGAQ